MSINKDNYEAWFLDFAEGTLSPAEIDELNDFLQSHPHLASELEEFQLIPLQPDTSVIYNNKKALKKEARIIPLSLFQIGRYAAAAILIMAVGFSITKLMNRSSDTGQAIHSPRNGIAPNLKYVKAAKKKDMVYDESFDENKQVAPDGHTSESLIAQDKHEDATQILRDPGEDYIVDAGQRMQPEYIGQIGGFTINQNDDLIARQDYAIEINTWEPNGPAAEKKGFLNTLATNIPRTLVPEVISEDLAEQEKKNQTLAFQVPNAPKRIFDSIFKN